MKKPRSAKELDDIIDGDRYFLSSGLQASRTHQSRRQAKCRGRRRGRSRGTEGRSGRDRHAGRAARRRGKKRLRTAVHRARAGLRRRYFPRTDHEERSRVRRALCDRYRSRYRSAGVAVRGAVRSVQTPQEAILRELEVGGHNLLAMGVSPRPGNQLFFGQVPAELLERAGCSVLFVASEPPTLEPEPHQTAGVLEPLARFVSSAAVT